MEIRISVTIPIKDENHSDKWMSLLEQKDSFLYSKEIKCKHKDILEASNKK